MSDVTPYKIIPIRLKGTNKTELVDHTGKAYGRKQVTKGNCLDPVRGCPSFANPDYPKCPHDCYSEEAVRRFKKDFGKPMSMELKEHLLRKDLRDCKSDWIRIGVDGAPSYNWELTTRVAEIVAEEGKIPLIVTRVWSVPGKGILKRLKDIGAILNITVTAKDPGKMIARRVFLYEMYRYMGGCASLRVVTFAFKKDNPLWIAQDILMQYPDTLEQPARIMRRTKNTRRKECAWDWVDQDRYHAYHSYITGKPNPRWRTAGQLYKTAACVKSCPLCENQCMVRVFTGQGDVLGRTIEVLA